MNQQFLTIDEKREWLARIFRDTSGEYTDADKFKAMVEDTHLAMISQNQQINPAKRNKKYRNRALNHSKRKMKSTVKKTLTVGHLTDKTTKI